MENIKICSVVVGSDLKDFLENLDKVQEISEMVELRVDQIKNLSEANLELIRKKTKKPAIFTTRKKETVLKALNLGFEYVDIELSQISSLDLGKLGKTELIISFHDFEKTPRIKKLRTTVNRMRKFKNGIIKIATMVNSNQDVKNLFQILLDKKRDEKMIIVGMGEKGQITRVLGPVLGSYLTYASTFYGQSAPGQLNISDLKQIYGR